MPKMYGLIADVTKDDQFCMTGFVPMCCNLALPFGNMAGLENLMNGGFGRNIIQKRSIVHCHVRNLLYGKEED